MKKGIAFAGALCLALLLTGCQSMVYERAKTVPSASQIRAGTTAPMADEAVDDTLQAILCFPDRKYERLLRVSRTITLRSDQTRESAVLKALLEGPVDAEEGTWPEVYGGEDAVIDISCGILTVNLVPRYRQLTPKELYAVRMAVAETLGQLPGIRGVVVLVGGREEGVDLAASMPAGVFRESNDNDILGKYNLIEEQRQGQSSVVVPAVMYLPDSSRTMLLAQSQTLELGNVTPVGILYNVLEHYHTRDIPGPLRYLQQMPDIQRTEDGGYRLISLHFTRELREALGAAGISDGLYMGMLTLTLMEFVPGVDGVSFVIGNREVTEVTLPDGKNLGLQRGFATYSDFRRLLGDEMTVYLPENGRLRREVQVVTAGTDSPRTRLQRVLSGSGLAGEGDLRGTRMERTAIVVNLSEELLQKLRTLTGQAARAAVYAMVNTLTEGHKQQKVIFFFDGKQVDTLGDLSMRGNLMRNPGMVEDVRESQ